jgi:hypothetical protein
MKTRITALITATALTLGATPALLAAGPSIAGTAKDEAKKPYTDYTVRVRDVVQGSVGGSVALDAAGSFALPDLTATKYLVELVDRNNKVVCTEGPFDLARQAEKTDVKINCNKVPTAWWLLGAAAAAGITAGVAAGSPAAGPAVTPGGVSVTPASAAQ